MGSEMCIRDRAEIVIPCDGGERVSQAYNKGSHNGQEIIYRDWIIPRPGSMLGYLVIDYLNSAQLEFDEANYDTFVCQGVAVPSSPTPPPSSPPSPSPSPSPSPPPSSPPSSLPSPPPSWPPPSSPPSPPPSLPPHSPLH